MDTIIEVLKAVLFGIVEGITEWLPISSTGHLIILQEYLNLNVSAEFWKLFEIIIQLGAIMAVVILFFPKIYPIKRTAEGYRIKYGTIRLWINIVIACIPAGIVGVFFDDLIDEYFYNRLMVATALIVVGIFFIIVENILVDVEPEVTKLSKISCRDAFIIGLFQLLAAIFPGTSRSGATIIGGLILGLQRKTIAEFTFFLAIPVMFGASFLKGIKYIFLSNTALTGTEIIILIVGTFTAFMVSIYVIKFLMKYIKRHSFKSFGIYRIVLGIIIILLTVWSK